MLTVAADDGIMPQTLRASGDLDLLGVGRGVVVVTKADLSSPERVTEVAREVEGGDRRNRCWRAPTVLAVFAPNRRGRRRAARPPRRGRREPADRGSEARGSASPSIGSSRFRGRRRRHRRPSCPVRCMSATGSLSARRACRRGCARSMPRTARPRAAQAGDRCALNLAGPDMAQGGDPARRHGDRSRPHAPDRPDRRRAARLLASEPKPVGQGFRFGCIMRRSRSARASFHSATGRSRQVGGERSNSFWNVRSRPLRSTGS